MIDQYLDIAAKSGVIPCFIGQPGIGKTAQIKAWAQNHHKKVTTLILSQMDRGDFLGLPFRREVGKTTITDWAIPTWWHELSDKSVLFLDEITNAPPEIRADFLTLLSDRKVNGRKLPEGCMIVCAANPSESAENAYDFSESFSSRLCLIHAEQDRENTAKYLKSVGNPLADYVKHNIYMEADTASAQMVKKLPVANDRTVELAGKIIQADPELSQAARKMIYGLVGPAVGKRIIRFLEDKTSNKLEDIDKNDTAALQEALGELISSINDENASKVIDRLSLWLDKSKRFDLMGQFRSVLVDKTYTVCEQKLLELIGRLEKHEQGD